MGRYILRRLVIAVLPLLAITFVVMADILYTALDPRLRLA